MTYRKKLAGKRILALVADGFEQIELTAPRKALVAEGAAVDVVSLRPGKIRGMNLHEPGRKVRVDRVIDEVSAEAYDGLLLPGGFISPDLLRQSVAARDLVRSFDLQRKPIATLCHGPWLLASAEVVRGRQLTSWPGIRDDLVHAGAVWHDEAVVRDRNWVSSRGPQDLPIFLREMIELFAEAPAVQAISPPPASRSAPARSSPPLTTLSAAAILPGPSLARRLLRGAAVLAAGGLALVALRRAIV